MKHANRTLSRFNYSKYFGYCYTNTFFTFLFAPSQKYGSSAPRRMFNICIYVFNMYLFPYIVYVSRLSPSLCIAHNAGLERLDAPMLSHVMQSTILLKSSKLKHPGMYIHYPSSSARTKTSGKSRENLNSEAASCFAKKVPGFAQK